MGTGASFKNNLKALARVRLNMRTMHEVSKPDLATTVLGQKLSLPVLCASLGGTTYNMGAKMTEEAFIDAVVGGAQLAGTMAFIADGTEDPLETYRIRLGALGRFGGRGVGVIKPRDQESIRQRVALIEEAGGTAVAIDIDSAGRAVRAAKLGQVIEPKTAKQLAEIAKATRLPLILKGVMTADEALIALDVGAKCVIVSNHGGRNLDHTPGTAEVLPAIAAKVKGKIAILADGGVRYGADVLKMLALGADAVLVGRPIIRGAHGGGAEGVQVILDKIRGELAEAMVLTGTPSVRAVPARAVSIA
jgi:4-hydroxymandelate oxidase